MASAGFDRALTIFSPEGKLYQVEYVTAAIRNAGFTHLAFKGKDSVVIVTTKKDAKATGVSDALVNSAALTRQFRVSKTIACSMVGIASDCNAILEQARSMAAEFRHENGYEMPVHYLAEKMGAKNQYYTQHAMMRMRAVHTLYFAIDEETGPAAFAVDHSGLSVSVKAYGEGAKAPNVFNMLEKTFKDKSKVTNLSETEATEQAIGILQEALGDFNAKSIEVGVIRANGFARLSEAEISTHLDNIAQKET